jgi:hypothetical protein
MVITATFGDAAGRLYEDVRLSEVRSHDFIEYQPARSFPAYRRQKHLPGFYYFSNLGRHIAYESRLEMFTLMWVLRYIGDPKPVGGVGGELTQHQVIEDWVQHSRAAWPLRAAPVYALEPEPAHEPLHALPGAPDAAAEAQLGVNARAAVSAAAKLVGVLDQLTEALVLCGSL